MLLKVQQKQALKKNPSGQFPVSSSHAEIKWGHGGDFKMMVFLKEAKHVALQPAWVSTRSPGMTSHSVWFTEKRREGNWDCQLRFCSNPLVLWAKLTSFYLWKCGTFRKPLKLSNWKAFMTPACANFITKHIIFTPRDGFIWIFKSPSTSSSCMFWPSPTSSQLYCNAVLFICVDSVFLSFFLSVCSFLFA